MASTRIVFMGTPGFAVPSLELLASSGRTPICVVTAPDRPAGRGRRLRPSAVKIAAERLGIGKILQPESVHDPVFAGEVAGLAADIIIVVAFRILPPVVFGAARLGTFNLHGSLLPRFRGAAPIHHAVLAGDEVTGVTTFFLREKVDTGDVILMREMPIGPDETTGEVHDRMMALGADVVLETVHLIEAGRVVVSSQNDELASAAPKVRSEDARIDWDAPAATVHNHIRGMSPVPGAWTLHRDKRIKVLRSTRTVGEGRPGEVVRANSRLIVACRTDAVSLEELQAPGKQLLPAEAFLRGYSLNEGDELAPRA